LRRAVFAYNHADWYVDSVILRARLISGLPADLVGSLTGLTQGHFPVHARARYADDVSERDIRRLGRKTRKAHNAAALVNADAHRRSINIFTRRGAPVIAVNDGVVKKVGSNSRLGRYIILQDVYGNRYTYAHLGSVSKVYPVPKADATPSPDRSARALAANKSSSDPAPAAPASAGRQLDSSDTSKPKDRGGDVKASKAKASVPVKQRLFAHPDVPGARSAGGLEQQLDAEARKSGKFSTFKAYFSRPFGLDPSKVRLRSLKKGSHVIGGTII